MPNVAVWQLTNWPLSWEGTCLWISFSIEHHSTMSWHWIQHIFLLLFWFMFLKSVERGNSIMSWFLCPRGNSSKVLIQFIHSSNWSCCCCCCITLRYIRTAGNFEEKKQPSKLLSQKYFLYFLYCTLIETSREIWNAKKGACFSTFFFCSCNITLVSNVAHCFSNSFSEIGNDAVTPT